MVLYAVFLSLSLSVYPSGGKKFNFRVSFLSAFVKVVSIFGGEAIAVRHLFCEVLAFVRVSIAEEI